MRTIRSTASGTPERRERGAGGCGAYVFIDAGLGEELEEFELAQRAETKEGVLERQHLFDGDFPACGFVHSSDDGAVSAFAEAMEDAVVITCGQMREETSVVKFM